MKFKKFVQQHIELIVICFSAILGVLEVVVARYPASMMILMVVFLIVPVMYVFKSSGRNYGKTLIGGLIIAVVFCMGFIFLCLIARRHECMMRIMLCPYYKLDRR